VPYERKASTMTVTAPPLQLRPMTGVLGAEVAGVDLSGDLSEDTVAAIRSALVEHQVLVFRNQDLSMEAQLAFGRRFGELDTHPFVHGNPDHPEILDIITEPDDRINFGGGWHTDVTFLPEPDLGSILYAVEVPPSGGDTLFASQLAAYDALSDTMKEMLDGLVAVHTAGHQYGEGGTSTQSKAMKTRNSEAAGTRVEHPVIRTHPESGRKGLYVNRAFTTSINGLTGEESRALLGFLFRHAVKEAFTCRLVWEPGTLAMWDNRSVQHYALHDYAGHRRAMRRITVKGDRPF
jgi:taurine dioxygenase